MSLIELSIENKKYNATLKEVLTHFQKENILCIKDFYIMCENNGLI